MAVIANFMPAIPQCRCVLLRSQVAAQGCYAVVLIPPLVLVPVFVLAPTVAVAADAGCVLPGKAETADVGWVLPVKIERADGDCAPPP